MVAATAYAGSVVLLLQVPLSEVLSTMKHLRAETLLLLLSVAGFSGYGIGLLGLGWKPGPLLKRE